MKPFGLNELPPVFVIPTYRLMDAAQTVSYYDQHFHDFGRKIDLWVFDDSPFTMSQKYYPLLEKTPTFNDVYYVGPDEKTAYIKKTCELAGVSIADSVINRIFRPSYGGNRNFALIYTLGRIIMSSDDDMKPGGYVLKDRPQLATNVVLRATSVKNPEQAAEFVTHDVAGSFLNVLGKHPHEVDLIQGEYAEDRYYDILSNIRKERAENGSDPECTYLTLKPLTSPLEDTTIKMAQTFMTGTNDIDSIDLFYAFLHSTKETIESLNETYVIEAFRPFASKINWRFACGVAGYDNREGLPPFFPTRLRFEDYIFRLWSQHKSVATAHVKSIQHHTRSPRMRPTLADDIYNEMTANFMKDKIRETLSGITDLAISFDYDGIVTEAEVKGLLDYGQRLDGMVEKSLKKEKSNPRSHILQEFRDGLRRNLGNYEFDTFLRKFSQDVDEEMYVIKDGMTYWERLVQITLLRILKDDMPIKKVKNMRK